jgi:hypothetical protein
MACVVVGVAIFAGLYIRHQRRTSEMGYHSPKTYLIEQPALTPSTGTK